jgi:CRISPR/Cas system CSM-associated protein Csm3 (group 7 of RAMP superfamily)
MNNSANQQRRRRAKHRRVLERFVVKGTLRLETPAHFGNGDAETFTDMPLLRDELDGSPLLPGTSIAGALRNYLREREVGFGVSPLKRKAIRSAEEENRDDKPVRKPEHELASSLLFGGYRGDDDGEQSPLIVHDAIGQAADLELRDGVRIEPETRTAEDDKKFDIQLLAAGSTFGLRFDLVVAVPDGKDVNDRAAYEAHQQSLLQALVMALEGLEPAEKSGQVEPGQRDPEQGEITLGARKRRGFGRCKVSDWEVWRYKMTDHAHLLAWLAEDRTVADAPWVARLDSIKSSSVKEAIAQASGIRIEMDQDQRRHFTIKAAFQIDGSLLIRAGGEENNADADLVHLHSKRPGRDGTLKSRPALPGTSWAGALRSRATQIANTLTKDKSKVSSLIERIFGFVPEEIEPKAVGPEKIKTETVRPWASRIEVSETIIRNELILQQSRVKIDRFTGGAFESALFDEQPIFGDRGAQLILDLKLRLPADQQPASERAEIGLLLLLLKDLWTGDLALGGEIGIGRGRLKGIEADLTLAGQRWTIQNSESGLAITGDKTELDKFVDELVKELSRV